MNLKKKLSIIVLLCFTLNMLLLFGYYELVLYDKIEESLNTMQIELRNDVNYISSQIKRLQGTDNIKDWINNIDNIDSINISIERGDNTLLYEHKTYEKSLLNVTFTDLINIKDNVYMIKVERPLQISKIRNIPFIKDIVVAEVVIGVFILIFGTEGFVGVHIVVMQIHNAAGDVAAVVADTLQTGEQVGPDEAGLDAAGTLLQTEDMAGTEGFLQIVDNLLQRLHQIGLLQIVLHEGAGGQFHDFLNGGNHNRQFLLAGLGEGNILCLQLFSGFQQIQGMVAHTFQITDGLQQRGSFFAFDGADLQGAELDQVGAQDIFVMVGLVFAVTDFLSKLGSEGSQGCDTIPESLSGDTGHFHGQDTAALQGQGGRGEKTLVQLHDLLGLGSIGHDLAHQLLQQIAGGQQNRGAKNVEDGMANRNAQIGCAGAQNGGRENPVNQQEQNQADGGTQNIEQQMDNGSPLGVLGGTHGGQHSGHAGTDILTHDDGDGSGIADGAGGGQRLQDTHGGGGGLDDGSQRGTGQDTQNGIGEQKEQVGEPGLIPQTLHGAGHGVHTEHQNGKAQQNHADVLLLHVLDEHVIYDADQGENGCKRGGLQQLDEKAVTVNAAKAQQPCGDRGTHIGTHNHIDGLPQGQQTGVDETDHHDGGCGGGLDDSGNGHTGEEAQHPVGGKLAQQAAQTVARGPLQSLAHQIHAEQKQTKAADHFKNVK